MSEIPIHVLNWDASNDRLLQQFIKGLPQDHPTVLNVFGSKLRFDGKFIGSLTWRDRAREEVHGNVTVYIASPLDVLVDNIKRLEQEHLDAFDLATRGTDKVPTEDELKAALMNVVDMYRPPFPEEYWAGDPVENTRRLWWYLYGHDIDVRKEIIVPAIKSRQEIWGEDTPCRLRFFSYQV
jgi:hypothetical protein